MKANSLLLILLSLSLVLLVMHPAKSQVLEVSSAITPEEMVEILIGSGLNYENVVFTGADSSRGQFWGGPGNIGLGNGIMLTSGKIDLAPGPNTMTGAGAISNAEGDADLEQLCPGGISYDACVLEFDFVPFYEYVWFQFVFASEEYPEYVGSAFNDVFGFFISGPGISGPFSNNAKNIALILDTEIPVSINNVNQDVNPEYFVENDSDFIQYDGFTTVLTAESTVIPMETYHIKLAIGDIADFIFDSGVFLQASSFCSGPVTGIVGKDPKNESSNYRIYPLPAGDQLNIESMDGQYFDIKLIGQDGRICKSDSGASHYSLDITSLPSGLYFLTITGGNGPETQKIFKR